MALQSILNHQRVVILDGATGTELEKRGIQINDSKLWSAKLLIQDPETLRQIHADYFRAGADVCTTATYQASVQGFMEEPGIVAADIGGLFVRAVELCDAARRAFWDEHCADRPPPASSQNMGPEEMSSVSSEALHRQPLFVRGRHRPLVAYSCGAYGASLADGSEFSGSYAETMTVEQLMDFHRSRLQPILGNPAVDLIAFETIPCLKELQAIVNLLLDFESGDTELDGYSLPPAWISVSCRDGVHTNHGERFAAECVPLLASCSKVAAIGINCTAPKHLRQLLEDASEALKVEPDTEEGIDNDGITSHVDGHKQPILMCYPNSGEEWDCDTRNWRPGGVGATPEGFACSAKEWVSAGAKIIGGCCRTTPEHIKALRKVLIG